MSRASFEQVGAWQVPNGDATYAYLAQSMTTTKATPQQIHETGLAEVKRIRAEMEKTKDQTEFKGSMAEFFKYLRTDPKFYAKSEDELLEYTRAQAKTIDPLLVKLFRTFPRLPYGVIAVPRELAMNMPAAYASGAAPDGSRPGFFYMNTYKPETRPKYEITSLILHEAVPGHTFQGGIAIELKDLPKFRRYGGYSAYAEGWALYCESLGDEMGLYDDPYVKFGRLSNEMWRAVRLVVDTGHASETLDTEAGHRLLHGERCHHRIQRYQRGRSVYLMARPGIGLQDGRVENQGTASARRKRAGAEVRSKRIS